jgi:hypothetical protein
MKTIYHVILVSAISMIILSTNGCKKDSSLGTEEELLTMAKKTTGFVWFKNSDALLPKSSLSGHSEPYLRTRYNAIAATMLDGTGKVQNSIIFPDGSLIVKELYSNQTTLSKYAILFKKSGHKDADSNGWVWSILNADGSIVEPAANKGNACISCHSHEGNVNYTLMNVGFP